MLDTSTSRLLPMADDRGSPSLGPIASLPPWVARFPRRLSPSKGYERRKRCFDLVVVLGTAPLWVVALASILIVMRFGSGGPVLYRQLRTGRHGERFSMWKLRTMVPGADEHLDGDLVPHVDQGPAPKVVDDPRVTPMGRLLRRTSLDELPQLWNVLRGDMSLVGPRPTSFPAETYRPWQRGRLAAQPGLTGLWQVLARGSVDFDVRAGYDLEYVARRSMRLDLLILLRTFAVVLAGRGAR
jgi:lipopolysaccharide/colanic/teichoic acid biosynthesis glycosyltransferase